MILDGGKIEIFKGKYKFSCNNFWLQNDYFIGYLKFFLGNVGFKGALISESHHGMKWMIRYSVKGKCCLNFSWFLVLKQKTLIFFFLILKFLILSFFLYHFRLVLDRFSPSFPKVMVFLIYLTENVVKLINSTKISPLDYEFNNRQILFFQKIRFK